MKAIAILPGIENSAQLIDAPLPVMHDRGVLVRTIRCGICGTDAEINQGLYGEAPRSCGHLILGHEGLGRVEKVGAAVRSLSVGDYVVPTVRRPDDCANCSRGDPDMCVKGDYTERGIKQLHGFLAEYFVELPEFLVSVPMELVDIGVLLEPLTVVEKGVYQAYRIQERLAWRPTAAVVLGAGPIGLLAAMLLRSKGLDVTVVARSRPGTVNSRIAEAIGARYSSTVESSPEELAKSVGNVDIIFEATGSSLVAMKALEILGVNGVAVLSSVTGGSISATLPIDKINQRLVLGNMVAIGTVNANRRDFDAGVRDLSLFQSLWPGALSRFITHRVPIGDFSPSVLTDRHGVKTTIEISAEG